VESGGRRFGSVLGRRTALGGGFAGWAFFWVVRRGGVGGMGCRSFDVRVVYDEFAVGVGSFFAPAHVARDR